MALLDAFHDGNEIDYCNFFTMMKEKNIKAAVNMCWIASSQIKGPLSVEFYKSKMQLYKYMHLERGVVFPLHPMEADALLVKKKN